jgi:hypothetical protein
VYAQSATPQALFPALLWTMPLRSVAAPQNAGRALVRAPCFQKLHAVSAPAGCATNTKAGFAQKYTEG